METPLDAQPPPRVERWPPPPPITTLPCQPRTGQRAAASESKHSAAIKHRKLPASIEGCGATHQADLLLSGTG
eukprot:3315841-Rhodomonas_salina.6